MSASSDEQLESSHNIILVLWNWQLNCGVPVSMECKKAAHYLQDRNISFQTITLIGLLNN